MAYQINKSDGSLLVEISDSEINTQSSSITLIGKNAVGYGEHINENFVKLLENFASTVEPKAPVAGQLWFDLEEERLKVYDEGQQWQPVNKPFVSLTKPIALSPGDIWVDSNENLLYYTDAAGGLQLASKSWKNSQRKSGMFAETVTDQFGTEKTITVIYNGGDQNRVGILSHHAEFTPSPAIAGFDTVKPGFNSPSNIADYKFNVVAASAESLVDSVGNVIKSEDFLRSNFDNYATGKLFIQNAAPLTLGANDEVSITSNAEEFKIRSNKLRQNISVVVNNTDNAIFVNALTNKIGIFTKNPRETLDVQGNVVIEGTLTVNGTVTTINSSELSVDDKLITLADTASPSDIAADGGGFVLRGDTDHFFKWSKDFSAWSSSESINLTGSNSVKFDNTEVLTKTTLGSSVSSAVGLSKIGTLTDLTVDDIYVNNSTISSLNGDLILTAPVSKAINVSNSRVTNVLAPINQKDAVNKEYVDKKTASPWVEVSGRFSATSNQRLLVGTLANSFEISLPQNPSIGDTFRFVDRDSSFNTNPLTIARHRRPELVVTSAESATTGTFLNVPTVTLTGTGTGLTLDVTINQTGPYTSATVLVSQAFAGINYADSDVVIVKGSALGGADSVNDLTVQIGSQYSILNVSADYVVKTKSAAMELVYIGEPGWVRAEAFSELFVPLSLPKFTTAEINAMPMASVNYGEVVYNSTVNRVYVYTEAGWVALGVEPNSGI